MRKNRRATTDGRPIQDNRVYEIRILEDGYGVRRSEPQYYRRHYGAGRTYTGPARFIPGV